MEPEDVMADIEEGGLVLLSIGGLFFALGLMAGYVLGGRALLAVTSTLCAGQP